MKKRIPRDHPRIRGEHVSSLTVYVTFSGSSPHPRGTRFCCGIRRVLDGIIPASAGNTAHALCSGGSAGDHPRIRGEHLARPKIVDFKAGSSPHPRGTLVSGHSKTNQKGIIPASAGNTDPVPGSAGTGQDHPRIRGEHYRKQKNTSLRGGIIPASAGNTLKKSHKIAISQNRFFKFHLVFHKSEML